VKKFQGERDGGNEDGQILAGESVLRKGRDRRSKFKKPRPIESNSWGMKQKKLIYMGRRPQAKRLERKDESRINPACLKVPLLIGKKKK